MATFTRGYSFGSTEQLTPAKMNQLINDGSLADISEADIGGDFAFYHHGDTAPSVSMSPGVWYDTTPGQEGLKFYHWSPSNASLSAWLYATPRREAYYYCSSPVSMGTPLFVSKVNEAGWSDYDGLSLPTVWLAGDREEITPTVVVAMESVAQAGPIKCAWTGVIPADTFGSQVSLGDLLYIDPDAPTKFKTGAFNPWAKGLLGHWPMEAASNATRADYSGNGLHLQCSNAVGQVTGKIGFAADFDDVAGNAQLSRATDAVLDWSSDSLMFSSWIYLDDKSGTYNWFFAGQWDSPSDKSWMLNYQIADDRLHFAVSTDGSNFADCVANSYGSPATGKWIHVLAWYAKAAGTLNICINNGAVDSVSCASSGLYVPTSDLRVGLGADIGTGWRLDGKVDQLSLWKGRTPSDWERAALYNYTKGVADIPGGETANAQSMIVGTALRKIADNSGLAEDFLLWGGGPAMQDIS